MTKLAVDLLKSPVPVGAMWDDPATEPKWNGLSLWVMTASGPWQIGRNWLYTMRGVPPDITLASGIWIPEWQYHGFLRGGFLDDCPCMERR